MPKRQGIPGRSALVLNLVNFREIRSHSVGFRDQLRHMWETKRTSMAWLPQESKVRELLLSRQAGSLALFQGD
jgi:hypothetical protein